MRGLAWRILTPMSRTGFNRVDTVTTVRSGNLECLGAYIGMCAWRFGWFIPNALSGLYCLVVLVGSW
jgi:hypothetical protein